MIILLVIGAAAVIGLLALVALTAYSGGKARGYLNGKIDGYRKCHADLTGMWPESPARRAGVVEREPEVRQP